MASKSQTRLAEVNSLAKKFDIKGLGKLHHFLGMKVVQDEATGKVRVGQHAYIENLLREFEMESAKPIATPVDASIDFHSWRKTCLVYILTLRNVLLCATDSNHMCNTCANHMMMIMQS